MKIKCCPFCQDMKPVACATFTVTRRTAYVTCSHCGAQGPSMCDMPMLDGKYELTKKKLTKDAIKAWNAYKD
jgi:transcription elongation factor Elf1